MSPGKSAIPKATLPVVAIAGGILFVSIGIRQGFGLFHAAVGGELGLGRTEFARSIAIQYLVWGLAGPIAGLLADRYSSRATLAAGGLLYALGFLVASAAFSEGTWVLGAGLLVGLGIGAASFAVVNAAVVRAVPRDRRGRALGAVAALTALGQLVLLAITEKTLEAFQWRGSLLAQAAVALCIVPLALALPDADSRSPPTEPKLPGAAWVATTKAVVAALGRPYFWLLGIGFALSGFHVMFTMTHLPAWVSDLGMSPAVAVRALLAVSAMSFLSSMWIGRCCDRIDAGRLLVGLYAARAAMAALAAVASLSPASLVGYFAVLGTVWMATIPVTTHLTARLFGTRALASVYGLVFMLHQIGGFAGTWLGGVIFDHTGSYRGMWGLIALLCCIASFLAVPLVERAGRLPLPSPRS